MIEEVYFDDEMEALAQASDNDFEELHVFDNSLSKYVPREMYEKVYACLETAAKKWGQIFLEEKESRQHFQAKADKRLKLLREIKPYIIHASHCKKYRHKEAKVCICGTDRILSELAEALVSEQSEEELGDG